MTDNHAGFFLSVGVLLTDKKRHCGEKELDDSENHFILTSRCAVLTSRRTSMYRGKDNTKKKSLITFSFQRHLQKQTSKGLLHMERLNIFVSSTCYDLSQIRHDLYSFISSLGHTPILSDYDSFPINPLNTETVQNCIEAVKNHADLLILIIGNRYGSIIETGKSITNTEFLTAKEKGIPIYVFIDKRILTILDVWKQNKTSDFTAFTDNPKIFDFIVEVRETLKVWTYAFEKAQDIMTTMNTQLSYLFKSALRLKSKLELETSRILNVPVSNKAIKVVLERSKVFEAEFFAQVLKDEVQKKDDVRNNYLYQIYYEPKNAFFNTNDFLTWTQTRSKSIIVICQSLVNLIIKAFKKFYEEPGEASDLAGILYVAKSFANLFESLVNWYIDTINTSVPSECINIKDKLAALATSAIDTTWNYPTKLFECVQKIKQNPEDKEQIEKLKNLFTISVNESDTANLNEAIEEFQRNRNSNNL